MSPPAVRPGLDLDRRRLLAGMGGMLALGCRPAPPVQARPAEEAAPLAPQALAPAFQAGFNLAHLHRPGLGYGSAACRAELVALAGLGVRQVALNPFGYVPSLDSVEVHFGGDRDGSLTDDHVRAVARDARALGLKLTLKPHLWSRAFWSGGRSPQDLGPSDGDWQAWFAGYTRFALHHARLAREIGAELYCVGLECLRASREAPGAWAELARACRTEFDGPLTYAANWWEEVELFQDWAAFDFVSVNAYYPLSEATDPSRAELMLAWQGPLDRLAALSARVDRPVLFAETGMQAAVGAAAQPWVHDPPGALDEALQARAYEALLAAAASRPWLAGIYWWKWFTAREGEHGDRYSPAGRPAEAILRRWWTA